MGLSLGNKNIGSIYKGDKSIGKIYLGDKLIYQKSLPMVLTTTIFTFKTVGSTNWISPPNTETIEYLVVAGGGAGSFARGGGGGAGGVVIGTLDNPISNYNYYIVVGAGGLGNLDYGNNGGNSIFDNIATAIGGGSASSEGGSGGGAYWNVGSTRYDGVLGQGNRGGMGTNTSGTERGGGGGGGSLTSGGDATATSGGKGGHGIYIGSDWGNIGINGYIAGGGGGGKQGKGSPGASGGLGGGGNASIFVGGPAVENTGSGGGASGNAFGNYNGGNGGSGIVVLKVTHWVPA